MSTPVDQAVRDRLRTELDVGFVIEAAAGTGKTQELVERIVACLARGRCRPEGLVALTFTRAAAGELKLRVRQRLEAVRAACTEPDVSERLDDAALRLDEASIETIHRFCADLLRTHPVEALVDPAFEELDEAQARALHGIQVRRWFEEALQDPPRALLRALQWPGGANDEDPVDALIGAAWDLAEWREHGRPWTHPGPPPEGVDLDSLGRTLVELGALIEQTPPKLRKLIDRQELGLLTELGRSHRARGSLDVRDDVALEADLFTALSKIKNVPRLTGSFTEDVSGPELTRRLQAWLADVARYRSWAQQEQAAELQKVLGPTIRAYQDEKHRRSQLDSVDLLVRTERLLQDDEVCEAVRSRVQRLFVDEFQDTDPLQTRILARVCPPESGALCLVGDPKQSIYGWRRADMRHYLQTRDALVATGMERVELQHSFRAVDELQQAVNAVFAPAFEDSGGAQPGYVPLRGGATSSNAASILVLDAPRTLGKQGSPTKTATRSSVDLAIANFVAWLVRESPLQIREADTGQLRSPRPDDVAVLMRGIREPKMEWGVDGARRLAEGLEALEIPFVLEGRRPVAEREEVEALHMALACLEWPRDVFRIYSTLRGPLFGFTDAELYRHRQESSLALKVDDGARSGTIGWACSLLARLSERRNERPVAETLEDLLQSTRAHAAWAHTGRGPQAVALVRHVERLAHLHEATQPGAFRSFIRRLEAFSEDDHPDIATHDQVEGVRILTAHRAKGLEFPVVVLADPFFESRDQASKYVEGDLAALKLMGCAPVDLIRRQDDAVALEQAETLRLGYVAATRARDLLVLVTASWSRPKSWYGPWWERMFERPGAVVEPPWNLDGDDTSDSGDGPRPGIHRSEDGLPAVAWLPRTVTARSAELRHGVAEPAALAEGPQAEAARDRHRRWLQIREERRESGMVPEQVVLRPSETLFDPPSAAGALEVEMLDIEAGRPAGARFGQLVHEWLRFELDPSRSSDGTGDVDRAIDAVARRLGAAEQEVEAARTAVRAALDHPLLVRARSARRFVETPMTLPTDDGQVMEGVLDLLFESDGGWTVVDFKTDGVLHEDVLDTYLTQIRWYQWAVQRTLGGSVRGVLLRV